MLQRLKTQTDWMWSVSAYQTPPSLTKCWEMLFEALTESQVGGLWLPVLKLIFAWLLGGWRRYKFQMDRLMQFLAVTEYFYCWNQGLQKWHSLRLKQTLGGASPLSRLWTASMMFVCLWICLCMWSCSLCVVHAHFSVSMHECLSSYPVSLPESDFSSLSIGCLHWKCSPMSKLAFPCPGQPLECMTGFAVRSILALPPC